MYRIYYEDATWTGVTVLRNPIKALLQHSEENPSTLFYIIIGSGKVYARDGQKVTMVMQEETRVR